MLPKFQYLFLIIQLLSLKAHSQSEIVEGSVDFSNKVQSTELIYLQTNKGIYEAGEDLWFKAYILDAQYFVPSGLSQTLYLQLVNEENGKACWQEMYEIQKRFASGHVYLPDTLPKGNYLLEAFTPHSFFKDSTEFESTRRIVVRKDMKPRVTIKTEFTRQSFAKGDSIGVIIHALSEQSKPLYAEITAELKKGDEILETVQTKTNEEGNARIIFDSKNTAPNLTIGITAKHTNATENLEINFLYHEGSPIQFSVFPEGGYLVSGLENTLAFKAVNINREPVDVEGTLFEDGDSLLSFKSYHAGMGSFNFVPDKNKKYHIQLLNPTSDSLWQLPEIKEEGIILHLAKRDSNFLYFHVKQKPDAGQKIICLRGQMRGNVYYIQSGTLKEQFEIKVAQKDFPQQGIAEFTLLNEDLIPIAERLVYVNPANKLYIKAELSKEKYSLREKATLQLKVTDEYNQPVVAHLGVTLFDKIYQNSNDAKNIFTHCYLSTQLKGRIYDPLYYFDQKNSGRQQALDLLLLTQGWRRYIWKEQTRNENNINHEEVIFDWLKGKIASSKEQKRSDRYQKIVVFKTDDVDTKYGIFTDSIGSFIISPSFLKLGQGSSLYLKPNDENSKKRISITAPFEAINKEFTLKNITYPMAGKTEEDVTTTRAYVPGPDIIELDEVTVKGKQNTQYRDKYLGKLDSMAKLNACFDYVGWQCGMINCPACRHGDKPVEEKRYDIWVSDRRFDSHKYWFHYNEKESIIYHYPKFREKELLEMYNLTRVKGYYIEREFYQPNSDKIDSLDFVPDYRTHCFGRQMY